MTINSDSSRKDDNEPADITLVIVGSIIIIGILFTGAMIFLSSSLGNGNFNNIETVNCDIRIYHENDAIELTLISGEVKWSDYDVLVNSTKIQTGSTESFAGEIAIFQSPAIIFEPGEKYNIRIVDIGDNRVVYENEITAIQ